MDELKTTHTKCLCTACGDYFNSTAAFDKHRAGQHGVSRKCMTHEERRSIKMDTNAQGYWVTELRDAGVVHWARHAKLGDTVDVPEELV